MKRNFKLSIVFVLLYVLLSLNVCVWAEGANSFAPSAENTSTVFSLSRKATIIPIEHNRSIADIVEKEKNFPHCGFIADKETRYDEKPNFTDPYKAGSLNKEDIQDTENALKMVRYLAGVPYEEICFKEEYNNYSQCGAVLMAATGQFDHEPQKPDDMDEEFFNAGYKGCKEANIYMGISNTSYAILGLVYDDGKENISKLGHRRWLLNPGTQDFGIGYAQTIIGRYKILRGSIYVLGGLGPYDCESDSYIAWPNSGAFPIQYFTAGGFTTETPDCDWSINLGEAYAVPNKDNIKLELTRQRDNKVWVFDRNTPDLGDVEGDISGDELHLSVDDEGYGIRKAIIFRPDLNSLGTLQNGDKFTVKLSGIKTNRGRSTTLEYEVNFFDLEKEKDRSDVTFKVKHNGNNVENAEIVIDGNRFYTDEKGEVAIRLNNNNTYSYSIIKDDYNIINDTITVETSSLEKDISLSIIEKMLVNEDGDLYCVASDKEKLVVPTEIDGIKVVSIAEGAFEKCDNLKELTILSNIESIDRNIFDKFRFIKLFVAKDSYAHKFAKKWLLNYEIITYKKGDILEDGVINAKDAVKLAQYLAKWDIALSDNGKKSADVVADDIINAKDAVKLAQYLAKWDIALD